MEDVITIRISRRLVRWVLIALFVWVVGGTAAALLLANLGHGEASGDHVKPIPRPHAVPTAARESPRR